MNAEKGIKSILQVDDDSFFQKMLQFLFEDEGVDIRSVSDESECFNSLNVAMPDLILLDEHLENALGYDIAKKIFQLNPVLPIIFVGASQVDELPQDLPGSVIGFIQKPINTETFVNEIYALRQRGLAQTRNVKSYKNIAALKEKYMAHLAKKAPEIQALWPPQTLNDVDCLIREIHKIAGSAGVYGFYPLSQQARALEECMREDTQTGDLKVFAEASKSGEYFRQFISEINRL